MPIIYCDFLLIAEEENRLGCFSPQFDDNTYGSLAKQELHCISNSACEASHVSSEQLESISQVQDSCTSTPAEAPDENNEVTGTVVDNKKDSLKKQGSGNCELVTVSDVLCVECKQLLFNPVALNCGHGNDCIIISCIYNGISFTYLEMTFCMTSYPDLQGLNCAVYCESCLIHLCDENIKCRVCESLNPKGSPKVCRELCQFLEERFPIEYALRRDAVQLKQVNSKHESLITSMNTFISFRLMVI